MYSGIWVGIRIMIYSIKGPTLIEGGISIDDRGVLTFANDFDFKDVKRFYIVENFSTKVVRAWHGHLKEAKYVFIPQGSAIIAAVEMDDPYFPSKTSQIHRFILSDKKPSVLFIPAGFANGFRPLEQGTKIMFFSTSSLAESKGDDFRFDWDYWGKGVWKVVHR